MIGSSQSYRTNLIYHILITGAPNDYVADFGLKLMQKRCIFRLFRPSARRTPEITVFAKRKAKNLDSTANFSCRWLRGRLLRRPLSQLCIDKVVYRRCRSKFLAFLFANTVISDVRLALGRKIRKMHLFCICFNQKSAT